jgi:hypothetical protein
LVLPLNVWFGGLVLSSYLDNDYNSKQFDSFFDVWLKLPTYWFCNKRCRRLRGLSCFERVDYIYTYIYICIDHCITIDHNIVLYGTPGELVSWMTQATLHSNLGFHRLSIRFQGSVGVQKPWGCIHFAGPNHVRDQSLEKEHPLTRSFSGKSGGKSDEIRW